VSSLRISSCFRPKTSQFHAELTNWPTRTNFCEQFPLYKTKWWACFWLCSTPALLFQSRWVWILRLLFMLSFPNVCIIIVMESVSIFRDLRNIWCTLAVGSIAKSHQVRWKDVKSALSPGCVKLWALTLQDTLTLSCTVASLNYNCFIDCSTSQGNYGYIPYLPVSSLLLKAPALQQNTNIM
jgi:hypothetical protein